MFFISIMKGYWSVQVYLVIFGKLVCFFYIGKEKVDCLFVEYWKVRVGSGFVNGGYGIFI